jgi:hypothetical protein
VTVVSTMTKLSEAAVRRLTASAGKRSLAQYHFLLVPL